MTKQRSRNKWRSYARQSVEIRRLATAATTRSDTYFSNTVKSPVAALARVREIAETRVNEKR
jgi:hypothetical protein